ncbi:DUF2608 domain-containing protein [Vibrio sp. HN007]|uniref:DUF2608 domain-containing protein n=1 Tax=Vibrio iocasae TaxID=3098914 RepID=UPI0035D4FB79
MKLNTLAALVTLAVSTSAAADVVVKETESFNDVATKISQLTEKGENPLVVIDIDNTLLTSTSDLGGDIWYQWQRGKLDVKPAAEDKVDCLFQDSIGLLYELVPQELIEKDVPATVRSWQDKGLTVFALTSRSPNYRAATEREMIRNGYDMTISPLTEKGSDTMPVYIDNPKRALSYINGIMMTTGMNKGTMLQYMMDKTGQKFDSVVFIDDSKKNVVNMEKAYKDDKSVDMTIFHYTKVEADRIAENGSVLTQKQADKMASDWKELNVTLDKIAPARIGDTCLGQ